MSDVVFDLLNGLDLIVFYGFKVCEDKRTYNGLSMIFFFFRMDDTWWIINCYFSGKISS